MCVCVCVCVCVFAADEAFFDKFFVSTMIQGTTFYPFNFQPSFTLRKCLLLVNTKGNQPKDLTVKSAVSTGKAI